jgi:hypothetical protein
MCVIKEVDLIIPILQGIKEREAIALKDYAELEGNHQNVCKTLAKAGCEGKFIAFATDREILTRGLGQDELAKIKAAGL